MNSATQTSVLVLPTNTKNVHYSDILRPPPPPLTRCLCFPLLGVEISIAFVIRERKGNSTSTANLIAQLF